jgi:hypothetical protein
MRGYVITGPEVAIGGSVRYAMNGWPLIFNMIPAPSSIAPTTQWRLVGVERGGSIDVQGLTAL